MKKVTALIMAGGEGSRLSILAEERAKPAVPFAGKYRIIDFTLSNCVHAGISKVGLLTQYRPHSLQEHIGIGHAWDLDRDRGGVTLLPPFTRRRGRDWYRGTADAVYQNLDFVEESGAEHVLVLAGDHIYRMGYEDMMTFHLFKEADVTVAVTRVPKGEGSRFGLVALNEDSAVAAFEEKPLHPNSDLASMGIYVFSYQVLREVLEEDAQRRGSAHDFGRNILPAMLGRYRVFGYKFSGYWRDVGTVESYWQANMDLLDDPVPLDMGSGEEGVRTPHQQRPPAKAGPRATVTQSLLCDGCIIRGTVRSSVLSQGVVVEEGALVQDSILFDDVIVGKGAMVHRSILDKEVVVGDSAVIGYGDDDRPNLEEPGNLCTGITLVGKRARVPAGVRIGRNCKVMAGAAADNFPADPFVPSGSTIQSGTGQLMLLPDSAAG